ncbi:tRNA pseudouridine(13) synthase TruD [Candidatus Woesearchaeota archaeon]|nr:tRNA pseudouridine(13) synthase TruD [Candidatus Woesearchaeota archaeon]
MYNLKQLPEDFIVEEIPLRELKKSGNYTYFLLEKRECNTEAAVQKIASHFKIPRKFFGYAGSKDRKAVTRQYCSVKGRIKDSEFTGFSIKVVGYGDSPVSLGDHRGNMFTIVVRNLEKLPKKTDFIINYFDDQRFGRQNLEIGRAILKKDFRKAAGLIDFLETKYHLQENPNDFIGAIRKVPFKTMRLYINSVQSWLWNEAAAEYVTRVSKKNTTSKYRHGIFVFPEKKPKNVELPLVSFDTEFDDPEIENLYNKIMGKERISIRDFIIRQIPDMTPQGDSRELVADVKDLSISSLEDDELNKDMKKATIRFELGRGCYATVVMRTIFSD